MVVPVAVAWSPHGRWIAGGGSASWGVWVWDASTGALRTTILPPSNHGWIGLGSIAFAPDGQHFAADGLIVGNSGPGLGENVRIWQLPD
ncbi:MAG TPA: WD40 repeat domain-containing protein [Roseiflexaceae bacterium]|nr:WD40 repeat domain-containing protein [Roseiflexaceae bacterium]